MTTRQLNRLFHQAAEAAGIKKAVTLHALRHSFATHLLELSAAIAKGHGQVSAPLSELRPLLRFTRGNPLTILVTVRQLLRDGLDTREKLAAFVRRLRAGESVIEDRPVDGRRQSLGASLSHGSYGAFERRDFPVLSLLHLFQGFVSAGTLLLMARLEGEWGVPALHGLTAEQANALLDRAAELGLLTAPVHRTGAELVSYAGHPALPWYFRSMFEQTFPVARRDRARSAFAAAIGRTGHELAQLLGSGHPDSLEILSRIAMEEENFLAAWTWAAGHMGEVGADWDMTGAMHALRELYAATGRRSAWRRLVEAATPHFADPTTDGPLPNREDTWLLVNFYRADLALQDHHCGKAERLQRLAIRWQELRLGAALAAEPSTLNYSQRNGIRSLGSAHLVLGQALSGQDDPNCIPEFQEAWRLADRIGAHWEASIGAYNCGQAYRRIATARDLDAAEHWIGESLKHSGRDRSKGNLELAFIAYERFREAQRSGGPQAEQITQMNSAYMSAQKALTGVAENDVHSRANIHQILGKILRFGGHTKEALSHYSWAIDYFETCGDTYGAGSTRFDVASMLVANYRLSDARAYAEVAIASYRALGDRAGDALRQAEDLLADITELIHATAGAKPRP
jgi:hypothetical protein